MSVCQNRCGVNKLIKKKNKNLRNFKEWLRFSGYGCGSTLKVGSFYDCKRNLNDKKCHLPGPFILIGVGEPKHHFSPNLTYLLN